jgi:hypothetical protein
MTTKACASGGSSDRLRSTRGAIPAGVNQANRSAATPLKTIRGLPDGSLPTASSRQATPNLVPSPSAFQTASLAAKRLA